jgi:molybdopterin converting factor small subunit
MKINVKSFAHLRLAMGKSPVTVEIPEGSTIADLINLLIAQYGETADKAIWKRKDEELKITPMNDGKAIALDEKLQDGMTVVFMSIVAAG